MLSVFPKRLSLTLNKSESLISSKGITWSADNSNVIISPTDNGCLIKAVAEGFTTITASDGVDSFDVEVTIVPWEANRVRLDFVETFAAEQENLTYNNGTIYAAQQRSTVIYKSDDGLKTMKRLPNLPQEISQPKLLFTPHGVFMRTNSSIFRSTDNLQTWTEADVDITYQPLYKMFDYYHDIATNTTYVYTGEYSSMTEASPNVHRVFRGTITDEGESWQVVYTFNSQTDGTFPSARHIHAVITDKSTGDLWVATGDVDADCFIAYSSDNGDTFKLMGNGDQKWRALDMWFTDDYIYWNEDSPANQEIWRLARTDIANQAIGNDLSEMVAELNNGSHWHMCWGTNLDGNDVVFMSASAEGLQRDLNARLFMIEEKPDNSVVVDEVFMYQTGHNLNNPRPLFMIGDTLYLAVQNGELGGTHKVKLTEDKSYPLTPFVADADSYTPNNNPIFKNKVQPSSF